MKNPEELKYSKSHEWLRMDGDIAVVGITDYAQHALGDVVFINLPEVGDDTAAGEPFGDIESVKAVSDLVSPVTGAVCEVNEALLDAPELVNQDPYDKGWLFKIRLSSPEDLDDLLTKSEYEAFTAE